jgi:hypothetical protein
MGQPPYGHATTPDPGSTLAQSIALPTRSSASARLIMVNSVNSVNDEFFLGFMLECGKTRARERVLDLRGLRKLSKM